MLGIFISFIRTNGFNLLTLLYFVGATAVVLISVYAISEKKFFIRGPGDQK